MIEDLSSSCKKENINVPTLIFTVAAFGSLKTLNFMEWLGIHVPDDLKNDLRNS